MERDLPKELDLVLAGLKEKNENILHTHFTVFSFYSKPVVLVERD